MSSCEYWQCQVSLSQRILSVTKFQVDSVVFGSSKLTGGFPPHDLSASSVSSSFSSRATSSRASIAAPLQRWFLLLFPPFSLLFCLLDAFSTSPYSFYCHLFPFIAIFSSSSFSTPSFLQPNPPRFSSHPIALTSSPPHPSFASTHPRPPATPRLDVAMVTRLRR